MSWFEGLVLGIVQGLTEFLPVSSSGHLVIGRTLFGLESDSIAFEVAVHGATLLAVLAFFRRRIASVVRGEEPVYFAKLALASVPIVLAALLLGRAIEASFGSPLLVAGFLAVTGTGLLTLGMGRGEGGSAVEPGWGAAIVIGCAQALALAPGISRSGATIVAALWLGMAPAAAAEFSFLLGIPAIAGAIVFESGAIRVAVGEASAAYGFGVVAAFGSAIAAIALVFRALAASRFHHYGIYCWVMALAFGGYVWWALT